MKVICIDECELLALVTVISSEWAKCVKDADELNFWGEFLTAIGTNLVIMADQRIRNEKCKPEKENSDSNNT